MAPGAAILIACRDLLFRSKVETTLRHMGMVPRTLGAAGDPGVAMAQERPAAAIVDLGLPEERWRAVVAAACAADPPVPVLAFGSHVDRPSQQAARAAGCDLVVANSRLARELPALVERLLAPSAPT
jgi:DNA-binding NarL/FixJ family response regulator